MLTSGNHPPTLSRRRLLRHVCACAAVIVAAPVLSGCGEEDRSDQPPRIQYGVDVCSRCGMIISEERYAAGLVAADGSPVIVDDIGEIILIVQEEGLGERRAWVHDAESLEWIDATGAFFSVSHDVVTPMGMGVTAFAERDNAESHGGETHGMVMTWDEMVSDWHFEMGGH
jgi:copper chaperone NosL